MPISADARRSILAPYLACLVVLVAMLPLQDSLRVGEVAIAIALQALVGVGLAFGHRLRGDDPLPIIAGILIFVASVALLRDGAGTGYGPLMLLPAIWAALRGRRVELVVAVVAGALAFAVPLLVVGPPDYPSIGWRSGTLIVLVANVVGVAVLRLVERLQASSAHSAAILGAMSVGFALTRDGAIVAVNPALTDITGFCRDDLLGARPPFPFWPPEEHALAGQLVNRVLEEGGSEFELTLMRADGKRFPASITCSAADLGDGTRAFVNTVRDITERRAHEEAISRRADELAAIASVTRAMGHSDPDDARKTICDVAVGISGASTAAIWEADSEGVLHNTLRSDLAPITIPVGPDQPQDGSRLAWQTGRPLFIAEGAGSPHVNQQIFRAGGGKIYSASLYFAPIGHGEQTRGVLVLRWAPAIPELPKGIAPVLDVLAGEAATAMERADLLNRLAELSRTDELTGLPNRRAWQELLEHELRVARRTGHPLSVVMLDLDHFKAYNDQYGHQGGDRLLALAAGLRRDNLRETDILVRWGGEEFGLLLPGCNAACAAELVARLHGLPLNGLTFSAGVSQWDGVAGSERLIGEADAALYAAKRSGRNRTCVAPAVRRGLTAAARLRQGRASARHRAAATIRRGARGRGCRSTAALPGRPLRTPSATAQPAGWSGCRDSRGSRRGPVDGRPSR
jgi:diguanylate cyclase (GGDEF)-like protein/PAS domain S-box-containing protein